jgi:hypothetical protein
LVKNTSYDQPPYKQLLVQEKHYQYVKKSSTWRVFCFFFFEIGLLCISGWPGIHYNYVTQAGLELRILCLSLPSAGMTTVHHHILLELFLLRVTQNNHEALKLLSLVMHENTGYP